MDNVLLALERPMRQKNLFRRVLISAVVFGASLLVSIRATYAQELNLRAVYNALSGVLAPIWIAQEGGLFSKQGVNGDLKYLAATTAVQGMVGGGEEVGLVGGQG